MIFISTPRTAVQAISYRSAARSTRASRQHNAILDWMPPPNPTACRCPTPFYAAAENPAEPSTTARPTGCAAVKSAAAAAATATASPE